MLEARSSEWRYWEVESGNDSKFSAVERSTGRYSRGEEHSAKSKERGQVGRR